MGTRNIPRLTQGSVKDRLKTGVRRLCRSPLERCRAPGASRTQLPFVCPLDQILRPSHFGDDPQLYGPPIAFREHSFWDNPDTPAELKVTCNFTFGRQQYSHNFA